MDTDWLVLLSTLGGSIIGAAVGAWIQGRWTEAGRLSAVTAAFQRILDQARERAKAEEEGRRVATHDDIENVLRELRLTTKEAEQIRSDIQHGVWERQNAWNLKRDMYIKVLDALGNAFSTCNEAAALYRQAERYDVARTSIPPHVLERAKELGNVTRTHQREVSRVIGTSGFVISADATVAAIEAFSRWRKADNLNSSSAFEQLRSDIDRAIGRVQQVAGKDLGIQRFMEPWP